MAGYIGSKAVSVNTTSATISDDLSVGDDLTVTDDATIGGTLGVTGVLTATSLDISGDIDVDGTTNLDVVDIDGAVNMATTLLVTGNVDFNGDLDVDGTTNLDATNIVGGTDINGTVTISPNTSGKDTFQFSTNASNEARLRMKNVDTTTVQIRAGGDSYFNGGDVFVGKTAASNTAVGLMLAGTQGQLNSVTTDAGGAQQNIFLNRQDSDGTFILFRKGNGNLGSIKSVSSGTFAICGIGTNHCGWSFSDNSAILPMKNSVITDNLVDLGNASYRMDDIFASNGTIQTSDGNEKQDIASLTSAEMLVAKRISALFKTFRWKDKVAANSNARTHSGIIAQDVKTAFEAEGLTVANYALWCSDTWWEHDVDVAAVQADDTVNPPIEAADAYTRTDTYDTEDEAPEGSTSRTRLGIRYPELLSFLAAYNEQRFAAIETRLTALEG